MDFKDTYFLGNLRKILTLDKWSDSVYLNSVCRFRPYYIFASLAIVVECLVPLGSGQRVQIRLKRVLSKVGENFAWRKENTICTWTVLAILSRNVTFVYAIMNAVCTVTTIFHGLQCIILSLNWPSKWIEVTCDISVKHRSINGVMEKEECIQEHKRAIFLIWVNSREIRQYSELWYMLG